MHRQGFKEEPNCVKSCSAEGLAARLEAQQQQLEVCEKALADYMESKRRAFPRFYFVSTADLLDILSNGNNPVHVMQHMSKCFQVALHPSFPLPHFSLITLIPAALPDMPLFQKGSSWTQKRDKGVEMGERCRRVFSATVSRTILDLLS